MERNSENDFIKHTNSVLFAADMNCILFAETWVAVGFRLLKLHFYIQSSLKIKLILVILACRSESLHPAPLTASFFFQSNKLHLSIHLWRL